MIYSLVFLLVIHYLADFLCQTREMATNKSSSIKWLTYHVLTYTAVLWISFGVFLIATKGGHTSVLLGSTITFVLVNGILHWCTDFLTSRASTHYYKQENYFMFFAVIGLDQLIHTVTLLLTFNYFLN